MKVKFIMALIVVITVIAAWNLGANKSNLESSDLVLMNIEAQASGEGALDHGRPLLESSSGAMKCSNCSGTDCGAAC